MSSEDIDRHESRSLRKVLCGPLPACAGCLLLVKSLGGIAAFVLGVYLSESSIYYLILAAFGGLTALAGVLIFSYLRLLRPLRAARFQATEDLQPRRESLENDVPPSYVNLGFDNEEQPPSYEEVQNSSKAASKFYRRSKSCV